MADIELVIKIPEKDYLYCLREKEDETATSMELAIANGTKLPKEHGRLIDADRLKSEMIKAVNLHKTVGETINDAPTVTEADKRSIEANKETDKTPYLLE